MNFDETTQDTPEQVDVVAEETVEETVTEAPETDVPHPALEDEGQDDAAEANTSDEAESAE